jgi:3-oxo-5alpha-steroid 4-dehydrogenase
MTAPLKIDHPDSVSWSDSADVVVVGFGGAGVAAALESVANGADTLAIDRFAGGGATAFSGGVIYAGATKYQRESGVNDTPDEMFKYLSAEGSAVSPETLRRYCEGSAADLAWLDEHGVPHGANAYFEKTSFPPHGYWIYYSGNEKLPEFSSQAKPAPRGHRVLVEGFGGALHFERLSASAKAKGVRLLLHAPVTRLVVDAAGTVHGVEVNALPQALWESHQKLYKQVSPWRPFNGDRAERAIAAGAKLESTVTERRLIRARRGVVLASGGFIYNLTTLRQYQPALADNYRNLLRLGSMGDDGSGMELGVSAGGTTTLMEHVCVARIIAPPIAFPRGIIVNAAGQRFVNEDAYAFIVGGAVAAQPGGGTAWLILEARDFWLGLKQSLFPGKGLFLLWGAPAVMNILLGGTRRARSLAALAAKCGIDNAGLQRTVGAYNEQARHGRPDALGKFPELTTPIAKGPYYAVNQSLGNRFAPAQAFTLGGLEVNEATGNVNRADGSAIKGLYAAGRVAIGLCSKGYMSGLSIADTVFSGRRAGREAARATAPPSHDSLGQA